MNTMRALSERRSFSRVDKKPETQPALHQAGKPAISVVGLGYVGAVSIACLSHLGFRMVGVDVAKDKVEAIAAGRSPIIEARLENLLAAGVEENLVEATEDLVGAVLTTDVTFVSVGTPTAVDGGADLTYVREASRAIGRALAMKNSYHPIVLRCSVPPGTTLEVVAPEIEAASGKRLGEDFGICFNPEFLREGVAVADFFDPPKTVIGASDARAAKAVEAIYEAIDEHVIFTSIAVAEMVKYVDNVWHATKVAFANEIGRLAKAMEIDSHEVMNIFVQDTKLNLSPYYMKPGFAFGGSCLPKEVRAVAHLAEKKGVDLPLVGSLMQTNQRHIEQALTLLEPHRGKTIGFLGLTFKPGTDDLRGSPTLELMGLLLACGETIRAFDTNLRFGPNLDSQTAYVRHSNPHLADLIERLPEITCADEAEILAECDVLVVSHATDAFRHAVEARPRGTHVLDLARLYAEPPADPDYEGIAW